MTTAFSLVNFRRACTCFFMSRWNLQWCFWSLLFPCCSVLLHRLSHDPLRIIRQNLAWSSRLRWIDGHFVFVPFLNNCTSSCHLLIKLMVNLVPDVLWQILGLILICQRTETDSVRRRALYRYEVEIRRIYNWLTDCNLVLHLVTQAICGNLNFGCVVGDQILI